jgi:PAS domain S-box-containing protein
MEKKAPGRFIASYGRYIIIFFLFIGVATALLYLTYENVKREMMVNLNARQMILAKQAAKGIDIFFKDHIAMLRQLAKSDHILDLDETGKQLMRDFYAAHAGKISIIKRIDREGRILHPEPFDPSVIRQSVVEREDFAEVKRTLQPVVSDVFKDRRGFKTIILHVPVFKKDSFNGTLAILFPFDFIAGLYVEDIRIGEDGYAWMISKSGIELSCPVPGHVGNSVMDNCRDFPDIIAMAEKMLRGEQGVTTYRFDRIRDNVVSRTTKQAVYMPIRMGNNFWSIVVATPEDEVLGPLRGFRNRLILIGVLLIVSMGFLLTLLFRGRFLADEIKKRRVIEDQLRSKTVELDNYFTKSLDLLCIADTDGYFRRLNPAWEETFGYPLSELEKKRFLDLVHPDDLDATAAAVGQLEDAKAVLNFTNRYRCQDGSYRWIEWRSLPSDKMIYAVARDITERKKMEEELRASEAKLQSLFRAAPIAIGILINRKLINANEQLCRMLGYKEDELLGQSSRIVYTSDEEFRRVGDEHSEQILKGGTGTIETRWTCKDGRIIHVLLSSSPLVMEDWSQGVMFTALDITERKKLESQLQQTQKMDAIGTLAGGIAHDFNNLLMAIQGNASLMLMKTDPGDSRYERLKAIEDQILTGAALTKQLLGFARGGRYEVKVMDINEAIERSLVLFGRTRKEISIHKKYGGDLWAVEADASQMEQVFMNLFINAWQAMPGGGHLYLETANDTVADDNQKSPGLKPGRYVKIAVTDTGVGMDEKTKERIFEPFFTTKEMGRGTGLGLAMVYGIVKGHKGYIDVVSQKGSGTTFTIYLPASSKEALKTEEVETRILKGRETILLVDDESAVIDVMKEMLAYLGYEVFTAESGRDAIAIYGAKKDLISLVILDMVMPDMAGRETFDRLKTMNQDIKVILSSGYSLDGEAAEIMARGCKGFIQKPVSMAGLSQKVREVLALGSYI